MHTWLSWDWLTRSRTANGFWSRGWLSGFKPVLVRWLGLEARLSDLPLSARAYLFGIWIASVVVLVWAIWESTWSIRHLAVTLLFAGLFWGTDLFPVKLRPDDEAEFTLGVSASIAAIMLLPPASIPVVASVGTGLAELHFTRPWYKKAFNIGQRVITLTPLAWTFRHIVGDNPLTVVSTQSIVGVGFVWIGQHLLNTSLVVVAISLALRLSPFKVWRTSHRNVISHMIFAAPLGTLFALLFQQQPLAAVLMLPPLYIMYRSLQLTAELRQRTVDALVAFANSVDARDPSTYQHSQRVAELAPAIARQMNLPPDEVDTIHLSARVHDLGKVGIPDSILFKPAKLSCEEYDRIKEHPVISARIVETFPLFNAGHDIIKFHHERYDGNGYPDGLQGEAIPLGARIMAVADTYDATTADRPYRAGLPHEVAVQEIINESGRQFDPQVVDAFLQVMGVASPAGAPVIERQEEPTAGLSFRTEERVSASACSS